MTDGQEKAVRKYEEMLTEEEKEVRKKYLLMVSEEHKEVALRLEQSLMKNLARQKGELAWLEEFKSKSRAFLEEVQEGLEEYKSELRAFVEEFAVEE